MDRWVHQTLQIHKPPEAKQGRAWNEAYLLHAFLQYNSSFKIVFFNTFLEHFFIETFIAEMPLCLKNTGASIWLKKM